jgi:hypothetical protein
MFQIHKSCAIFIIALTNFFISPSLMRYGGKNTFSGLTSGIFSTFFFSGISVSRFGHCF